MPNYTPTVHPPLAVALNVPADTLPVATVTAFTAANGAPAALPAAVAVNTDAVPVAVAAAAPGPDIDPNAP